MAREACSGKRESKDAKPRPQRQTGVGSEWARVKTLMMVLASASEGIVLQKSKVAGLKIFRENTKQRAVADSYDLNRVTEVACEFCVRT